MHPRRALTRLAVALCASALLNACASSSYRGPYASAPARQEASGAAEVDEAPAPPPPAQPAATSPATTGAPGVARGPGANTTPPTNATTQPAPNTPAPMLIYTADLRLQVERARFDAVLDGVMEAARAVGGYLVRRDDTSIQVRVPSARFHESVHGVEGLGEVLHRNVSAEDVSEEFHDAEVRLANLRAVRARLEEFLRRAGTMAEALQVERELERVSQEIDRIEGRMRFLSSRAAFSLVTVALQARPQVIAAPRTVDVPPRRMIELPVRWLRELGLERLLQLSDEEGSR